MHILDRKARYNDAVAVYQVGNDHRMLAQSQHSGLWQPACVYIKENHACPLAGVGTSSSFGLTAAQPCCPMSSTLRGGTTSAAGQPVDPLTSCVTSLEMPVHKYVVSKGLDSRDTVAQARQDACCKAGHTPPLATAHAQICKAVKPPCEAVDSAETHVMQSVTKQRDHGINACDAGIV
jgi:hypothetical protein